MVSFASARPRAYPARRWLGSPLRPPASPLLMQSLEDSRQSLLFYLSLRRVASADSQRSDSRVALIISCGGDSPAAKHRRYSTGSWLEPSNSAVTACSAGANSPLAWLSSSSACAIPPGSGLEQCGPLHRKILGRPYSSPADRAWGPTGGDLPYSPFRERKHSWLGPGGQVSTGARKPTVTRNNGDASTPSWCAGCCINFVLVRRLLRQL